MQQPIQLWLPTFGASANIESVGRDIRRGFDDWRGETFVWFLPGLERSVRWAKDGIYYRAVPAENLESAIVIHIGISGHTFPRAEMLFPEGVVDDRLLDSWLGTSGPAFVRPPDTLQCEIPRITPEGVVFQRKTYTVAPGAILPISSVAQRTDEIDFSWPPKGHPSTVSPEAESLKHYGGLTSGVEGGLPVAVTPGGERALHVLLRWSDPMGRLMPLFSGIDDITAKAKMVAIAGESAQDLERALSRAKSDSAAYLSEGRSTRRLVWFRPEAARRGSTYLIGEAHKLNLRVPEQMRRKAETEEGRKGIVPEEFLRLPDWRRKMSELVPVRRAWGAVGLFWALLIDRLEDHRASKACERCGRILQSGHKRKFCGPEDDPVCFKARRAATVRKGRHQHPA